jgi:choline dehydrogenase-like flavoprotein
LAAACPIDWLPQVADPEVRLTDLVDDVYHPSGTTRMGRNPAESVVGSDLRCHRVPNLTICSASVFPSAGSANPTLALMQLALRAGDYLAVDGR